MRECYKGSRFEHQESLHTNTKTWSQLSSQAQGLDVLREQGFQKCIKAFYRRMSVHDLKLNRGRVMQRQESK